MTTPTTPTRAHVCAKKQNTVTRDEKHSRICAIGVVGVVGVVNVYKQWIIEFLGVVIGVVKAVFGVVKGS